MLRLRTPFSHCSRVKTRLAEFRIQLCASLAQPSERCNITRRTHFGRYFCALESCWLTFLTGMSAYRRCSSSLPIIKALFMPSSTLSTWSEYILDSASLSKLSEHVYLVDPHQFFWKYFLFFYATIEACVLWLIIVPYSALTLVGNGRNLTTLKFFPSLNLRIWISCSPLV